MPRYRQEEPEVPPDDNYDHDLDDPEFYHYDEEVPPEDAEQMEDWAHDEPWER